MLGSSTCRPGSESMTHFWWWFQLSFQEWVISGDKAVSLFQVYPCVNYKRKFPHALRTHSREAKRCIWSQSGWGVSVAIVCKYQTMTVLEVENPSGVECSLTFLFNLLFWPTNSAISLPGSLTAFHKYPFSCWPQLAWRNVRNVHEIQRGDYREPGPSGARYVMISLLCPQGQKGPQGFTDADAVTLCSLQIHTHSHIDTHTHLHTTPIHSHTPHISAIIDLTLQLFVAIVLLCLVSMQGSGGFARPGADK